MTIAGITGHQNLTDQTTIIVRSAIIQTLSGLAPPIIGLSSLAAGSDQIFADEILEAGGTLRVIQPCRYYRETFTEKAACENFERLIKRADSVVILPYSKPSEDAFLAAGLEIAKQSDFLLAVWDGTPSRGRGGTGDVVAFARNTLTGVKVVPIWPKGAARSS